MKTDIPMNGSMVKNHISFKKWIRIPCNSENFVPIVVPCLSSSFSGSSSTSKTPSRQESHCSSSSSNSSSSPTVSDTKTREREDRTESDISRKREERRNGPEVISQRVQYSSTTQATQTLKGLSETRCA